MFDGLSGRGESGKKKRGGRANSSSVLLLTVGAISRSDGKIRSISPSLNCNPVTPLCFLFWSWLMSQTVRPPWALSHLSHSHTANVIGQIFWPRHIVSARGLGRCRDSPPGVAWTPPPCHAVFHMTVRHVVSGASLPSLSPASRYEVGLGDQPPAGSSKDVKQGP